MNRLLTLAIAVAGVGGACGGAGPATSSPTAMVAASAAASPTQVPLAGSVTVFAGSSLTDAFKKAGEQLRLRSPGTDFVFNFGSSSTLATQIINGAPADVFASADDTNMQKIVDAKLTDGTPQKAVFREPQTWSFLESFKVRGDRIIAVEATFTQAPYFIRSPWTKKPDKVYDAIKAAGE